MASTLLCDGIMEKQLIAKCCDCGDVRTAHGWRQEPEQGQGAARRVYTHTYCPTCLARIIPVAEGIELDVDVSDAS
jgi:hypothetical protein